MKVGGFPSDLCEWRVGLGFWFRAELWLRHGLFWDWFKVCFTLVWGYLRLGLEFILRWVY